MRPGAEEGCVFEMQRESAPRRRHGSSSFNALLDQRLLGIRRRSGGAAIRDRRKRTRRRCRHDDIVQLEFEAAPRTETKIGPGPFPIGSYTTPSFGYSMTRRNDAGATG